MNNSPALLLGTRKGLLTFGCVNGDWTLQRESFLGAPIAFATHDRRTGFTWACADHGHWGQKLYRSPDGGATWAEVAAPKYPAEATLADGTPATLRYLWVVQPGGDDEPNRLYIGTEPGGLFVSDDNGDSFALVTGLWDHPSRKDWFGGGRDKPGIHSILVDPRDHTHLFAAVSVAGVFESRDHGATWAPCNRGLRADFLPEPDVPVGHDPHLVVACPGAPDVLWQQNHCGIFASRDGGANWRSCSVKGQLAHFGFAIAVDAARPETAWVVPAMADECRIAVDHALCVCRTEDGGETWQPLREGLPQSGAYDIVFRHALDLAGDRLAFGTTTGNVYISEDRGDHWQCLGNHLPPVYSVRFG